jgi:phytoene desaturase
VAGPKEALHAELSGYFRDLRLQLAFTFQSKYLGMSPFRCPSLFSIFSFLEYEHGIWHPIGGCNALTRGMARVAEELGVKIKLSTPVEEILFQDRRATGVRTAQGELRADAVVMNADFANGISKLVPNALRRRWSDAKLV